MHAVSRPQYVFERWYYLENPKLGSAGAMALEGASGTAQPIGGVRSPGTVLPDGKVHEKQIKIKGRSNPFEFTFRDLRGETAEGGL